MKRGKTLIAKKTLAKANKVLKAMNTRLDKIYTVAKVSPTNKKVVAELNKLEADIVSLYRGFKRKVASVNTLGEMDESIATTLNDIAIVATKLDLLKSAIAESVEDTEEIPENVTVDDVLSDLGDEEDNGTDDEDNGTDDEEDDDMADEEDDQDNDGIPDIDEEHGELPEGFDGDHEDAMDLMGDNDDDTMGDNDDDTMGDDDDDSIPVVTAKRNTAVKTNKKAVATKRTVKKTLPESGVSSLFNFIGGGR